MRRPSVSRARDSRAGLSGGATGQNDCPASFFLILFLLALAAPAVIAEPAKVSERAPRLDPDLEHLQHAVVRIRASEAYGELMGTGFFIDPAGTLYTSYSVGGETSDIKVKVGPVVLPARRLVADRRSGIAILKVDAETPYLPIAAENFLPEIDSPVTALGYPLGGELSNSDGVVSAIDARNSRGFFATSHLRARVPVLRGMGGAPLLNAAHRVIGIVISKLDDGAGCHALPIRAAEKVRADFLRFGEVRPAWMGVEVLSRARDGESAVAVIDKVSLSGPAAAAGIQPGDILLSIGQARINRPTDIIDAAFYITAGDTVPIVVERLGKKLSFTVATLPNPSYPADTQAAEVAPAIGSAPPPLSETGH